MIHGLDTGFLVAAEVREHAAHADARATLAHVLSAGDFIAIAPQVLADRSSPPISRTPWFSVSLRASRPLPAALIPERGEKETRRHNLPAA